MERGEERARGPADALADGLVVPFLNGIDHVARLRKRYSSSNVVAAPIRVEVARVGPGLIRHTSPFAAVELATSPGVRARVEKLADHLRATGLVLQDCDAAEPMIRD